MHARAHDIATLARYLHGVRYRKQGRKLVFYPDGTINLMMSGLDCAGLIACVGHSLELGTHDCLNYGDRPDPRQFMRELLQAGCTGLPQPENLGDLELGCIMLMAEPGWPVHSALYVGPNPKTRIPEMVHSWLPAKKVCCVPFSKTQRQKFRKALRFPEV